MPGSHLNPRTLPAAPAGRFDIEPVLELGGDPETTLRAVARLRAVALLGPRVNWRGRLAGALDVALLFHLPPPAELRRGDAESWRAAYRPGVCRYRRGPGFVEITDARGPGETLRFLLDTPDEIAAFTACLAPVAVAGMPAAQRAVVARLADRGLVLTAGDKAVALPYRTANRP